MTVGLSADQPGNLDLVPLYSCDDCGWVTTASWVRAVESHALGSPDCGGTVELVAYAGSPRPRVRSIPFPAMLAPDEDQAFGGSGNAA